MVPASPALTAPTDERSPMLSDVQKRKLTRMFDHLDADKDGVLVRGDYDRMCRPSPRRARRAALLAGGRGDRAGRTTIEWSELEAEASADGRAR